MTKLSYALIPLVAFIAIAPINTTADLVKDVVAAGDATVEDICTEAVAAACEQYGVK